MLYIGTRRQDNKRNKSSAFFTVCRNKQSGVTNNMAKLTTLVSTATNAVLSAVELFKKTTAYLRDESTGNMYLQCAFSEGKGSGKQLIREDDMDAFIGFLTNLAENGLDTHEEGAYVPASVMAANTVRFDDENGVYLFRTNNGKGSKPAKLTPAQLSEVANHLKSNRDNIFARFNGLRSVKVS